MRDFASSAFRLRQAPRLLRLIYAGFLVLAGAGLLTQAGFQAGRIGLTPARIAMYYRGGETEAEISLPKPFGHLVEVTHAHAFTIGPDLPRPGPSGSPSGPAAARWSS